MPGPERTCCLLTHLGGPRANSHYLLFMEEEMRHREVTQL